MCLFSFLSLVVMFVYANFGMMFLLLAMARHEEVCSSARHEEVCSSAIELSTSWQVIAKMVSASVSMRNNIVLSGLSAGSSSCQLMAVPTYGISATDSVLLVKSGIMHM